MLIDQPKIARVFAALDTLREVLPELAIIFPDTAVVDGAVVAAMPAVEHAIGIVFEAATVAMLTSDETSARWELAKRIQDKAQAALDAKFGG